MLAVPVLSPSSPLSTRFDFFVLRPALISAGDSVVENLALHIGRDSAMRSWAHRSSRADAKLFLLHMGFGHHFRFVAFDMRQLLLVAAVPDHR